MHLFQRGEYQILCAHLFFDVIYGFYKQQMYILIKSKTFIAVCHVPVFQKVSNTALQVFAVVGC